MLLVIKTKHFPPLLSSKRRIKMCCDQGRRASDGLVKEAEAVTYKFWEKKMGFGCLAMTSSRGEFRKQLGYRVRGAGVMGVTPT